MKVKILRTIVGMGLMILTASTVRVPDVLAIGLPGVHALSQKGLFDAEQYHGQVVYLDFWASWCKPCKESFPWMQQMHKKYEHMGLKVIAVNLDKKRAMADQFLKINTAAFPVLFDPSGVLADKYQLAGMPMSYIIDRSGVIRHRHIGYVPSMQAIYEMQILGLLKK